MTNEFTKYIDLPIISSDIEYIRAQIEIFESKLGLQLYMAQIYQKQLNDLKKMDDEDPFRKYIVNRRNL
ncbi:MAG: hypothetical protein IJ880_10455 [Bacilli bacterium]|nr:hypothetical protein [Bacilli bacterium]